MPAKKGDTVVLNAKWIAFQVHLPDGFGVTLTRFSETRQTMIPGLRVADTEAGPGDNDGLGSACKYSDGTPSQCTGMPTVRKTSEHQKGLID